MWYKVFWLQKAQFTERISLYYYKFHYYSLKMNIDEIQRKKKCISTFFYLNKLSNIYRTSKTTFETNRNTPKHQLQCMYSYNRAATKPFKWVLLRNHTYLSSQMWSIFTPSISPLSSFYMQCYAVLCYALCPMTSILCTALTIFSITLAQGLGFLICI